MDCQVLTKIVFLIFVILLGVYVITTNKPLLSHQEQFENSLNNLKDLASKVTPPAAGTQSSESEKKKKADYPKEDKAPEKPVSARQKISKVYKELYGTEPTEEELEFYVRFFRNKLEEDYMREVKERINIVYEKEISYTDHENFLRELERIKLAYENSFSTEYQIGSTFAHSTLLANVIKKVFERLDFLNFDILVFIKKHTF
jgi:hypothetical protein